MSSTIGVTAGHRDHMAASGSEDLNARAVPYTRRSIDATAMIKATPESLIHLGHTVDGWLPESILRLVRQLAFLHRFDARLTRATGRFPKSLRPLLMPGLVVPLVLTLMAYALFFAQAQLLAVALDLKVGIIYLAVCLSVAGMVTLLPISFSGLGTRDAILIALFAPLGLAAEQAVAFSPLFFLTFYVGGGIYGAVAWQLKPLAERPTELPRST
jgi:uncharacterized membrane protein YbhN (UPF0104 family)